MRDADHIFGSGGTFCPDCADDDDPRVLMLSATAVLQFDAALDSTQGSAG